MKRVFVLLALFVCVLPAFASCGLDEQGALDTKDGSVGPGDAAGVDGGNCWSNQKVCDSVCTPTSLVEKGCAGSACEPCNLPHATAECGADGLCAVASCEPGWENCDKNTTVGPVTGCEAQIAVDPKACGAACKDCQKENGPSWNCCNGECVRDDCIANGMLNCDCAGECDVAITDVNNCGFCNHKCEFDHATATCDADSNPTKATNGFACHFQCNAPWADCDGLEANGCEVNLNSDTAHCGSCTKQCNGTNGTPGCSGGSCEIVCNAGWGNCDNNPDNGCEIDLKKDNNNCGSCGNACTNPHGSNVCGNGTCTPTCAGGWADCDGNPSNGCETSLNQVGTCGACNTSCSNAHGTTSCPAGTCAPSCAGGYDNCDSNVNNGCETPLNTPANCGNCTTKCGGGTPLCCSGACQQCCTNGNCTGGKTCQGGSCVCPSPLKDCSGTCRNCCASSDCTGGHVCNGSGNCVCPSGQKDCSGTCQQCCVNSDCNNGRTCQGGTCACPSATPKACSTSCAVDCCASSECTGGQTCQSGTCKCPAGQMDCSGTCQECCNTPDCSGGMTCQSGSCKCTAGQKNCGGTCKECCGDPDCTTAGEKCCNGTCTQATDAGACP